MTVTAQVTDPDTCLDGLQAQVDGLLGMDPAEWSLEQLERAIRDVHTITARLAAVQARALACFDTRGGGQIAGARTTGDWLAKATRMPPNHAGWAVHTARALRDHLPATAAALADGVISVEHVKAIRGAWRQLDPAAFTDAEAQIVAFAAAHDVRALRAMLDLIIQNYRKDTHDKDAEDARERRRAHLSCSLDGWWHLDGHLDPATGAALAAALDLYAQPVAADDPRSPAQRTADALAEIATRALDPTDRPTGLGHITLTLTQDQLATGLGAHWPSGLLASTTDIRTTSCSAHITYVVGIPVDDVHWQPLAVGFAERYATKAQRAALAARDGNGCIHPGCTVPAHRCIAHHIRHWDHGGPTNLDNLVLICHYHHRRVHHGKLTITTTEHGHHTTHTTRTPPLE